MAEKKQKSQAEKAASAAKNKSGSKQSTTKKKAVEAEKKERSVPVRVISSLIFLGLFVLFLVIAIWPEGAAIKALDNVIHGVFGDACFIISIPAFLYLFTVHAFSGKRPVCMRSICIGCFVLICGCLAHLVKFPKDTIYEVQSAAFLYSGGISGKTGGVIPGYIAIYMCSFLGKPIFTILTVVGAILTLLAGMQITIPSIVRAIQNRPRADWEKEEKLVQKQEPAEVVVNHIANKRIAHIEQQRAKAEAAALEAESAATTDAPKRSKAAEIMSQIEGDIETPVAAAGVPVTQCTEEEILTAGADILPVPETMPPFEISETFTDEEPVVPAEPPKKRSVKVKKSAPIEPEVVEEVTKEIEEAEGEERPQYIFPPISLLRNAGGAGGDGMLEMRENTERLKETLASFKIAAHIINVTRGPSVTLYEVELEKGVRLNKLVTAADDIALSLGASGVRIAAITGKNSIVGIEVPNQEVNTVSLREVINSANFTKSKSKSSFAVGKDIGGNCIVGNISKLPHMLIAGTTGSGKSVCMNSLIISLLYKASPDDVKLIMVDPKMVELRAYDSIPHLLIPVVTDPKKAAGALQWAVTEMMRRYKAMSDTGVRDLESYNRIIESHESDEKKLPQVVVIIDELADLMLVAAKEVEESICRIAQMGRAAGIHLVIATQRPSADVITGLMKANIPSRIAFAVASAMESRIILDTKGAEKLVGKGDMLYAPIGCGEPKRVQGCFVSDEEVEAVTNFVKNNSVPNYDQDVMKEIERKAEEEKKQPVPDPIPTEEESEYDELLPAAVEIILDTRQASVSWLQRRLKLGYSRAARIVDQMEELGVVGPHKGSAPRDVLITKDEWEKMQAGQNKQLEFDDLEVEEEDMVVPEDF